MQESSAVGDPGPSHPLRARVEAFERSIIAEQFESAGKNQSETARRLGVSRPALIEKLHKYGLLGAGLLLLACGLSAHLAT
jgi:two-component system response regulator AtoC